MIRALAVAVALVVTSSSAGLGHSQQLATPTMGAGQDAPRGAPLADDPAWLELQDWVSQLRGLPILRDVRRVALSPAELRERQAAIYRAHLDPAELESTRQLLVGFGLLNPRDDLETALIDLYGALPIGLYDPLSATLYVRGAESNDPLERLILAHEFTHALQDQHYDLLRLLARPPDDADRALAVATLVEGDALIVQEMYYQTTHSPVPEAQVAREQALQQSVERVHEEIRERINLEAVPEAVFHELYFPYLDGPGFIHAVVGTPALTTWGAYGPAMQALFTNPPQSTAQILHPEKYLRGEQPVRVELPDLSAALGGHWRLVRRQVMGELDHQLLLARHLPQPLAEQAAAGWAGNRVAVLVDGAGRTATASATVWDSPTEATEWADSYVASVAARYGADAEPVWVGRGRWVWRLPDQAISLERAGNRTVIANAPTVDAAEALVDGAVARALPDLRRMAARLLGMR